MPRLPLAKRLLSAAGRLLFALAVAGAAAYAWFFVRPLRRPHPPAARAPGSLVIAGARVYVSPDAPALEGATVVVTDGRIVAVGADARVPDGARVVRCRGCVVFAGFWNAHVHLTEAKWDAGPAAALNASLADIFTSRGFTTVVDLGSNIRTTVSLRRRIEEGELTGPAIYTAGGALYPPNGLPFYIRESVPHWVLRFLNQPVTPGEAVADVEQNVDRGADLVKLFTGSYVERGRVLPMPVAIARAAVDAAHRHGQLVFAHPSDLEGTRVARDSGVDVLAHAPDTTEGIDEAFVAGLVAKKMAMVPTLKMFATTVTKSASYLEPIHRVVRRFRELGGEVLFGTDVGYMTDYATEDEYAALVDCGLSPRDILRALTTAPAARFGVLSDKGTIEVGKSGDLVIFDDDPVADPTAFGRPRATVRGGALLFERDAAPR